MSKINTLFQEIEQISVELENAANSQDVELALTLINKRNSVAEQLGSLSMTDEQKKNISIKIDHILQNESKIIAELVIEKDNIGKRLSQLDKRKTIFDAYHKY
ncbi:flagellar protein FliT [Tolumonas lignilytica]|uniref:flagellar protein FliT n=1 Tax=Tolumonas lignilytica TaxID=1283284 RepID=UPI000464EB26|nr:flagellar protein FliT [Tolumonas lignilytica]